MFLKSTPLPQYLEDALAPFVWSAIFSGKFHSDITSVILAANRKDVIPRFVASLRLIKFLDAKFVDDLCNALLRFSEEGFKK